MSTQRMRITRWPCHLQDRHADKITTYGWSTSRANAGNECTLVHPMPHIGAGGAAVGAVFQTRYAGSIPVARSIR
jgi:hypothetical protein